MPACEIPLRWPPGYDVWDAMCNHYDVDPDGEGLTIDWEEALWYHGSVPASPTWVSPTYDGSSRRSCVYAALKWWKEHPEFQGRLTLYLREDRGMEHPYGTTPNEFALGRVHVRIAMVFLNIYFEHEGQRYGRRVGEIDPEDEAYASGNI